MGATADPSTLVADLGRIVGSSRVSTAAADRRTYARDSWTLANLRLAGGRGPEGLPGAVVWPQTEEQVGRVLAWCSQKALAVVPCGAGSGVCGGAAATRGEVALDLKGLDRLLEVRGDEGWMRCQTGVIGEVLERELNRSGVTLGHFPSSLYCSTLGGYLAARSAGQMSALYGKIEDMVVSVRGYLAGGEPFETGPERAGDFTQAIVGSEGTLAVITAARMLVHPLPEVRGFLGFTFRDPYRGMEAIRRLLTAGPTPAVVRLYDELDTLLLVGSEGADRENRRSKIENRKSPGVWTTRVLLRLGGLVNRIAEPLLRRCLLVVMFEGPAATVPDETRAARALLRAFGGREVGGGHGRRWLAHRYDVSYKASGVYFKGGALDTLEVAAPWEAMPRLYREVKRAIEPHAICLAHFSHAYPEGCSIYFTFAFDARRPEAAERRYLAIWDRAMTACLRAGGTVSHHHGIGLLKVPYLRRELGAAGRGLLEHLKRSLDPGGMMNPGKLGLGTAHKGGMPR